MSSHNNSFKNTSFLLVAHYATFAYQDLLYSYLTKKKASRVTKINFPLPDLPLLHHIDLTHSVQGKKVKSEAIASLWRPTTIAYLWQAWQYFWLIVKTDQTYDIVIAEDSLLAFISIILRFVGKIKKVIFYSHGIDFTRFQTGWANKLYQLLDRFSAQRADYNWFLSQNMFPIRKDQGIAEHRLFWIPSSLPIDILPRKQHIANHTLIFLGVINDKNGVGILPDIILEVKKRIPDVRLDIMGDGDMKNALQKRIKSLGLSKNIRMLGNRTFPQFKNIITNYRAGLVTYKYSTVNLIPTSDSMKMRVYLTAGLPVVLTKGFIFSDEIKNNKLGFTVDYDPRQFAAKLIQILTDQHLSDTFRKAALLYSKKMDLTKIYDRTFQSILG